MNLRQTKTPLSHHPFPKQVSLHGQPVIQYCRGIPGAGSSYSEHAELIFLLNGKLKVLCGQDVFEIVNHQLVLVSRNILVEIINGEEGEMDLRYIRFTITTNLVREFTRMSNLCPKESHTHAPVVVACSTPDWVGYVESLEPILLAENPQPGLVKIKLLELLFHLSTTDNYLFGHVLDIREHYRVDITATVEENITNSLSLEQLAALSGRSLSSFRRDFMAIYQMTPSQWIRLKRLEKARELLLSTTMTVTDICYTLGFEHIAHFSRLFKAHFGYPPSCFKNSPQSSCYRPSKS